MTLQGGCFCGAVRYEIEGTPPRTTHCHCIHCRRTSGAPFVTWAECNASQFRFTAGDPGRYASRPGVERRFCTRCGTQLTYQRAAESGSIDVTAASLDTPSAVQPQDHLWCDRMLPWVHLSDGLPRHPLRRPGKESGS
jgi:hypothetical protein